MPAAVSYAVTTQLAEPVIGSDERVTLQTSLGLLLAMAAVGAATISTAAGIAAIPMILFNRPSLSPLE